MINRLKTFAKKRFPFLLPVWRQILAKSPAQTFTEIYRHNKWGDEQSLSGPGSNLEQSESVRIALPLLVKELKCKSLLDVPCGDFFWMKMVDLNIQYIGGDIVADLVNNNNRQYAGENRKFVRLDIIRDWLPKVDFILCRDCFIHFSYLHTLSAIKNIKRSGASYLLTSTYVARDINTDMPTGGWRPVNLQLPPYNFPAPIKLIDEKCPRDEYRDKSLGLWRTDDIPNYR